MQKRATFRVFIWLFIAAGLLRGLWVFDMGGSANSHETVAAGLCFAAAMLSTVLMFCFDSQK